MDEDIRQLRQLANITTPEHDPTNPTSKPPSNDMPSSSSEKGDFASDLKPKDVKPDANSSFYYSQLANISTPGEALSSPTPLCMPSKPSIIFPIYIYPSPGAWDPLYNAYVSPFPPFAVKFTTPLTFNRISHNPSLHFIIIINPHNGPGESKIPDENYSTEIPKLNSYPNVTTLGYIALNYSHKKSLDVVFEVKKYAGWAKSNIEGLYVAGVFFDEVPNLWDHLGGGKKRQLDRLNSYVRKCEGIGGDRLVSFHSSSTFQILETWTVDIVVGPGDLQPGHSP